MAEQINKTANLNNWQTQEIKKFVERIIFYRAYASVLENAVRNGFTAPEQGQIYSRGKNRNKLAVSVEDMKNDIDIIKKYKLETYLRNAHLQSMKTFESRIMEQAQKLL